jgi:drug/metabolite transporter (DMT)-like permease
MRKHQLLTVLALGIVYVVWGSTFYGVKLALEGGLMPFFMIGLRFLLAGAALYAVSRLRGGRRASPSDWLESAFLSFLMLVCGTGLVAWAVQWIPSSLAALLVATSPVWVTLLDPEQKLTSRKWLGLLLGLLGVGWLVGASLQTDGEGFLWGCVGCLASALAWAVGSLRGRRSAGRVCPITQAGMQMICGGSILLAVSWWNHEQAGLGSVTGGAWAAFLYLTLFGSLVAYSAYTWLVNNVPPGVVATHGYVNPVVAVLLGALLGGEVLTPQTGLAAGVTMLGVVVLMLPEQTAPTHDGPSSPTNLDELRSSPRARRRLLGRGTPARRAS